jgi:hypothetical protein
MVEITDLAEAERKLNCLPNLEKVIFGLCGIDKPQWGNSRSKLTASPIQNEDLAAYRDRVREKYKVIWTVRLGPSIALRTDADNFMPNHFGVGRLPDDYAHNLRYCTDMVCLDLGHMRMTDISFNKKGYQWRSFERTEGFDETKFTWTVDDETVATVDNGYVTTVAPGRTIMRVYYKGEQVASCIIRCNWTEEPETPSDPENPDDPDVPVEPPVEVKYEIKINNVKPAYQYNNQENSAEVTQAVGHKFKLTLVDKDLAQIMSDAVWTLSDDTVCQLDGNYVIGLKKGTCKITCEYDGVTYLVFVRVTN